MPQAPKNLKEFNALLEIVKILRGPEGCPWDKEQTHKTLTRFALEEAFELAEAIDEEDQSEIVGELGDLLFQVVLHAEIGRQEARFEISDVIEAISSKMIRRHPHVFGDVEVENSEEVIKNWSQIKAQEKTRHDKTSSFAIPESLPALIRSQKIGEKTSQLRFDWTSPEQVLSKVDEELEEVKEALKSGTSEELQAEIGDLLFSVAQLARHVNFDPEQSLRQCNKRFERRFFKMQELAKQKKLDFPTLSDAEVEALWAEAKQLT